MADHLTDAAAQWPDRTALVSASGDRRWSYADLERAANQSAAAMTAMGLAAGDCVAICMPNSPEMVAAICGAYRIGLYYTLPPLKSSPDDLRYVVENSGSRLLLLSASAPASDALVGPSIPGEGGGPIPVLRSGSGTASAGAWEQLVAGQSAALPQRCLPGIEMIYSSGSTGRPKGIRTPLPQRAWNAPDPRSVGAANAWGIDEHSICLSTSPLYHSAPHRYLMASLSRGATVVIMERFDAQQSLGAIERFGCTHALWVPTMFHRLLQLDDAVRSQYRLTSMTHAIHGAAPCPVHVKQAMIDWWGPVLYEYYSGTEGIGATFIDSHEWLLHKGSVGKPHGARAHILDEDNNPLPSGAVGTVFFESATGFSYWRDDGKTRAAISPQGWRTFGDIGYLDADGYLYLTDRKDFMIISGGVNIYPQEIENALLEHPDVADATVFGVPDPEFGERTVAIVQARDGRPTTEASALALREHCIARLGRIKAPKQVYFVAEFPRQDSGKVLKKRIREQFLRGEMAFLH